MPTATLQKNTTKAVVPKKAKTQKTSLTKEMSVLFGNSSKEKEEVDEAVSSKKTKTKVLTKDKETTASKKEAKAFSVENIETSSISKEETEKSKEKSSLLTSFLDKKKNIDESSQEKKKDEKVIVSVPAVAKEKSTEKPTEKKSFFSSLFGKKKTKEEVVESALSNSPRNERVSISEPVKATPIPQRKIENQKKLSTFGLSKERDQFIENLSMLVLSGMSIIGALSSIIKQTKSPGMKAILERMLLEIESGSPVWKALDRTKFFKGYTISLIRLGEESGNFAENLKVVALEEEKDREFKSKVKSALMYPIFVLGLTGIVGIGISWFILPKLAKIFYDLKLALPLITKVLLSFGLFLNKHGLVAVPLGAAVIGGIGYIVFGWSKTKFMGEAVIFSIPGIKSLLMEVEVARFGYLLGTLLEAGLPVTRAIDSLASATEVIRYKKFYLALRESIDAGNSFEKSFAAYKNINALIPPPVQQLIISGEQSGNLNKTLIKVGQVLEAKSDTTTKNLTIIMEPILLVIVWAGVVSVAFAVILPIYSLVGGMNTI